jgi:hypothetical protein
MTDQAMSPLRRRMIEDMSIRKFTPGDPTHVRSLRQGFLDLFRPVAG